MKKRIMTLMTGMLLLLTACGQTGDRSASTMLPVAAVQSAAQAIAPVEDKVQEDTESLSAEETVEETKDVGDEETPNPTEDAETPSTKAEGTPSAPAGEEQPDAPEQPTVPGQAEISAPQPEPAPSEAEPILRADDRPVRSLCTGRKRVYLRQYPLELSEADRT